ncbi:hypothetical protein KR222_001605 [Zaprionus bogoriensis]|nr:hypothetical protein KR222_001605 [Zaprionus bogoriensis]
MENATGKPVNPMIKKLQLRPRAVAALPGNSLQLPSSSPANLTSATNGNTTTSGPSSGSATGNPRNKCALKPGYSLMGWVRLCGSGVDLAGTGGRTVPVSRTELARHNQVTDAWMAIRGKVFNVTRYMDYHPGGVDELMRGVGRDATELFDEVHAWVNYAQLLAKCYVGPLTDNDRVEVQALRFSDLLRPPPAPTEIVPRFDWIQQSSALTLCFYTRRMANPGLLARRRASAAELELRVQLADSWHIFQFKLSGAVDWPPKSVRLVPETGKIEVVLTKQNPEPWTSYGSHELSKLSAASAQEELFDFEVVRRESFNHDSFELCLQSVQQQVLLQLPVGYHLDIQVPHKGQLLQRSYTPVPRTYLPANAGDATTQNFLIKHYEHGAVSSHLHALQPGAMLQLSLPRGNFQLAPLEAHRDILLLAAGSGLTPMLSLLQPLLDRQANRLERLHLKYFNKTQADIWLEQKLQALQDSDERFSCTHMLSDAADKSRSRLPQQLREAFSEHGYTYVLICGPTGFNAAVVDSLKQVQPKLDHIHVFQG